MGRGAPRLVCGDEFRRGPLLSVYLTKRAHIGAMQSRGLPCHIRYPILQRYHVVPEQGLKPDPAG